ncbi:MAG: diphosphate--fructose-6-phosphate 1-phosphotransferase [Lentisphaeria bacterium]|jgi:6-phosphofructokinase 1|nr:diphosphate--fructose-6-phosphate 1-phosphotransferase [Lentisphaeria bacterium]MDP7742274.1 diphosphate--fructose-6-phosphate 1-phosphotransferase [Lentisphaeria bacterium]
MTPPARKLLVLQAGGPTTVINATLHAVIASAGRDQRVSGIVGARHGLAGLRDDDIVDLTRIPGHILDALPATPGAFLGSSRDRLEPGDGDRIASRLVRDNIGYVIMIGGNGTMCAAHEFAAVNRTQDHDIAVVVAAKTVDNDIVHTDRCPGFGSAARFVTHTVRELLVDVQSLPVPVSIYETMGRDAGWLAGAAALAGTDRLAGPQLVALPEQPFELDAFLGVIDDAVSRDGWAVAVVSEGIRDHDGKPVHCQDDAHRDQVGRPLPGGVSQFLADQVGRQLKLRCRNEKPGICGRSAMPYVSAVDRADATACGQAAVGAAVTGSGGRMVGLAPLAADPETLLVPLDQVAGNHRTVPPELLDPGPINVNEGFLDYVRPLIGDGLPVYPPIPCG